MQSSSPSLLGLDKINLNGLYYFLCNAVQEMQTGVVQEATNGYLFIGFCLFLVLSQQEKIVEKEGWSFQIWIMELQGGKCSPRPQPTEEQRK